MTDRLIRTGLGYDVHRLVPDRKLILGGVEIPWGLGLLGHSDADVLAHAIADALLGAAGLGDIGVHFPDSDPSYEGISSMALLERISRMLHNRCLGIEWLDATVVAQKPKIRPFTGMMQVAVSRALGIPETRINIKATTTEGLGFEGREEGIAAHAIATLSVQA